MVKKQNEIAGADEEYGAMAKGMTENKNEIGGATEEAETASFLVQTTGPKDS